MAENLEDLGLVHPDWDSSRCLDADRTCKGAVQYRTPLSSTGQMYPRCDKHWSERLDIQEQIDRRYPEHAPSDFDPSYAGESWDEDY